MQFRTSTVAGLFTVCPMIRRLDASIAPQFKTQMLEFIDAGHHRVALDLSEIEFIDSTGLGALVVIRKALEGRGELVIRGVQPNVWPLFRLTRMDKIFRIDADKEARVAQNR